MRSLYALCLAALLSSFQVLECQEFEWLNRVLQGPQSDLRGIHCYSIVARQQGGAGTSSQAMISRSTHHE